MENLEIKTPIRLVPENGKLAVRVIGKDGDEHGLIMGTDFEESDIQAVMNFAEEVYKIGYNDGKLLQSIVQKSSIFIAVIAMNIEDFLNWKKENNHIPVGKNKFHTQKRYTIGNTSYICIVKPQDCRGWAFNEIIETSNASLNSNYTTIIECIKHCLKTSNKI
jgi:hypothetical protein